MSHLWSGVFAGCVSFLAHQWPPPAHTISLDHLTGIMVEPFQVGNADAPHAPGRSRPNQRDRPTVKRGCGIDPSKGGVPTALPRPHFTFRFEDVRLIPSSHPKGVEAGQRVDVFRIDRAPAY
jgi:hypothetical protein